MNNRKENNSAKKKRSGEKINASRDIVWVHAVKGSIEREKNKCTTSKHAYINNNLCTRAVLQASQYTYLHIYPTHFFDKVSLTRPTTRWIIQSTNPACVAHYEFEIFCSAHINSPRFLLSHILLLFSFFLIHRVRVLPRIKKGKEGQGITHNAEGKKIKKVKEKDTKKGNAHPQKFIVVHEVFNWRYCYKMHLG